MDEQQKQQHKQRHEDFKRGLSAVINTFGIDTDCGTPDFILADVCYYSLQTFHEATDARTKWQSPVATKNGEGG